MIASGADRKRAQQIICFGQEAPASDFLTSNSDKSAQFDHESELFVYLALKSKWTHLEHMAKQG